MRKLKLFVWLWVFLNLLGACGFAPMPGAAAQSVPGMSYVTTAQSTTPQNWSQSLSSALTGCPTGISCTVQTVTLTPCPIGVDTTTGLYEIYISDGSNSEAVSVTGGSCTSGASSGTITFTPYYSHSAGPIIGSASSGIQETWNVACGTGPSSTYYQNSQCHVVLPANGQCTSCVGNSAIYNNYNVYGTIFLHGNQSELDAPGVVLFCDAPTLRGPCIDIGYPGGTAGHFNANLIVGLSFRTPTSVASNPSFAGVAITNTAYASNVATITTTTAHGFRPGDLVTILFTDNKAYWGDALVQTVPTSTTFTFTKSWGTISSQSTPGVVALAYEAVWDGGQGTHFSDIQYDFDSEAGHFNNFFDFGDDENALIEHFNNNGASLNANYNWTGSFFFSGGNPIGANQWAPVITVRDSSITANGSNCVTDYNSNGVYFENTVCQASGLWQIHSSNEEGNYQGVYVKNIYSESVITLNPPCSPSCPAGALSPFPGTGIAGLVSGGRAGVNTSTVTGIGQMFGAFQTGGSGSTPYTYYIVVNCTGTGTGNSCPTAGSHTAPMQVLNWESTGSDSIPVHWPRVANGADSINYDVLRCPSPSNTVPYPYYNGTPGGSAGVCGYVATAISQISACLGTLVCTYTDSGSASTLPYTIQLDNYAGTFNFWPGSLVVVGGGIAPAVSVDQEHLNVVGVGLNGNPIQIAKVCTNNGTGAPTTYTACPSSYASTGYSAQAATILGDGPAGGGGASPNGVKGRLNFTTSPFGSIAPHHFITLIDSLPGLTRASNFYRPAASAGDTWIGVDCIPSCALNAGQLAFGSPVSISNYISATGGVANTWSERLSASLKEFNIPVKFDQVATVGVNSALSVASVLISPTAPTISSGFGTSPSIPHNNGTAAFTVKVGAGGTASSGVVGLPTATNGWNCFVNDATNPTTGGGFYVKMTANSTTSATLTGYNTSGTATAWTAGDILGVSCFAY